MDSRLKYLVPVQSGHVVESSGSDCCNDLAGIAKQRTNRRPRVQCGKVSHLRSFLALLRSTTHIPIQIVGHRSCDKCKCIVQNLDVAHLKCTVCCLVATQKLQKPNQHSFHRPSLPVTYSEIIRQTASSFTCPCNWRTAHRSRRTIDDN